MNVTRLKFELSPRSREINIVKARLTANKSLRLAVKILKIRFGRPRFRNLLLSWFLSCTLSATFNHHSVTHFGTLVRNRNVFSLCWKRAKFMSVVVGAVAGCSTHTGLQHWNFGHRNCCASVERSMSWRRLNVADGDQCPSQVRHTLTLMLSCTDFPVFNNKLARNSTHLTRKTAS